VEEPGTVSDAAPAGGLSPAGAREDKPQQASQPSVSRNAVEAEINSLNQIAGIDWREETGSSVGIIDEMVEAMDAADRRDNLLQQREGRSIPPLPPGGPPFFRYGKGLVSVLDGMNSVPAAPGRVLGWMRLPPPCWRNLAHSLSRRMTQMTSRSKLQFEQPKLFLVFY